jgi:hypothetical protein
MQTAKDPFGVLLESLGRRKLGLLFSEERSPKPSCPFVHVLKEMVMYGLQVGCVECARKQTPVGLEL